MFVVYTKHWFEDSMGAVTEGPWVREKSFPTKEEADKEAAFYEYYGRMSGVWTEVREEKEVA